MAGTTPDAEEPLGLDGLCPRMAADRAPGVGAVRTALVPRGTDAGGLWWLCGQLRRGMCKVITCHSTGLTDQTLGHTMTGTVLLMGRVPLSWKHSLIVRAGGHTCSSEAFSTHGFK